ncbi:HAMP domain-containing sensor histidine kinase [Catenulispora yoronensis]|uniref:histidine kinase n=1 Tax=Catenulispora yoronensis TaxID=450799 RepID=A0ABN2V6L7_9ACTN
MTLGRRFTARVLRDRLSMRTIRMRLTVLYGSLFLVSGAGLLTATYLLVRHAMSDRIYSEGVGPTGGTGPALPDGSDGSDAAAPPGHPIGLLSMRKLQQAVDLNQLAVQSAIALTAMVFVSVLLGWLVAGRVLRPLRVMAQTAQDISASNLHERLALAGPDDELRRLGDTIDALLERLEKSFSAQKQFVANASHELRTPLARQRTLIQVALSDPDATVESLRDTHERALVANRGQERLIDALLLLARSEVGLERRLPLDLAAVARQVTAARMEEARRRGLQVDLALHPAPCPGEPRLIERLVVNLVDNALRHNTESGFVHVSTSVRDSDGCAVLTVGNSGPVIPAEDVGRLLQPFQRLGAARSTRDGGLGLGLSIVKAIADAHGAELVAEPRPTGGLGIEVRFPA